MGRLRVRVPELLSCNLMLDWITFMGYFFWVSLGQSFWFAWFTVHIWYISGSSHVCARMSQPRWILPQRPMGRTSLDIIPLCPPRNLFCACWIREVSWFQEQEICGLCRVQPPLNCPPILVFYSKRAPLVAQTAMQETQFQSLSWVDPLEKGMATHSSILAWRIPWTEKPVGLQSIRSQRVGYNWVTNTHSCLGVSVNREWISNWFTLWGLGGGDSCLLPLWESKRRKDQTQMCEKTMYWKKQLPRDPLPSSLT